MRTAFADCFTSSSLPLENPKRDGNGQLSTFRDVIVPRTSCSEPSQVVVSPRLYFFRPQLGWSCQISPTRVVIVKWSSGAEQPILVISPRQYFMSSLLGWIWAVISSQELLMSKEAPAQSSRRLLNFLVVTSWDSQTNWSWAAISH